MEENFLKNIVTKKNYQINFSKRKDSEIILAETITEWINRKNV